MNIANTAKNYLQATQLIVPNGNLQNKEAFSLNPSTDVLNEITPYLKESQKLEPLVTIYEVAWQQRFGQYNQTKAVRSLKSRKNIDPFVLGIKVRYIAALENNPYTFDEQHFINEQAQRGGRSASEIAQAITSAKPHTVSVERDSVMKATVSGGMESLKLEPAVLGILQRLGFEASLHIDWTSRGLPRCLHSNKESSKMCLSR